MNFKAVATGFSRNTLLAGLALFLLIAHSIVWMFQHPLPGHDQCVLLYDARRMLAGLTLYGPYNSETNPPLIVWFSALPVALSKRLPFSEATLFYVVVSAMACLSVTWCVRMCRVRGMGRPALLLLATLLVLIELPETVLIFGQREALLLICILPFIFALVLQVMPQLSLFERCALGLAAGLGVCFKPQQTLMLIGIECAAAVLTRSFRRLLAADLLCAVGVCFLYLGAIRLFAPLYISDTLPILVDTYWAIGSFSAGTLFLRQYPELLLLIFSTSIAMVVLKDRTERNAVLLLVSCALAASSAFDIQHTGWGYQRYPAMVFTALAVLFALGYIVAGRTSPKDEEARLILKGAVALAVVVLALIEWKNWKPIQPPEDFGIMGQVKPGESVYVFSTDVSYFDVAYVRHLDWGSRFMHLWMLPAILENEHRVRPPGVPFKALSPARVAQLARMQRTETAEDLERWKPKLVLIGNCPCAFVRQDVNLLQWFSQDASFRREWGHYSLYKEIAGFHVYERQN